MHGRRWKSRAFFITIIMANLIGCCYFTYQFWNLETPSTALADLESRPNTSEFFDAENKVHFRPTIGELVTFNYTSTLAKGTWELRQVCSRQKYKESFFCLHLYQAAAVKLSRSRAFFFMAKIILVRRFYNLLSLTLQYFSPENIGDEIFDLCLAVLITAISTA